MSSTTRTAPSTAYTRKRERVSHVHTYKWPWIPFNAWMFLMLLSSCTIVGVFSSFIGIQYQLELPVPWLVPPRFRPSQGSPTTSASHPPPRDARLTLSYRYFPYYITVASFSILYVGTLVFLLSRHRLLPAIVMIGAFLVLVLWFVGLVVVAIQLWGSNGVNGECNLRVFNENPKGDTRETLAWMMERSICKLNCSLLIGPRCEAWGLVYYGSGLANAKGIIEGQSWHAVFAFSLVGMLCLIWVMVMAYNVFVKSL